jgi:hypothetical protein
MESSAAVHGDVGVFGAAGDSPRRRMVLLIAAVLVPFAIAFAVGAATKSTPSSHGGASLAPAVSLGAPHAAVTALKPGAAVPALKAVPTKHAGSSNASAAQSSNTGAASSGSTSLTQSNNTVVAPPPTGNTSQNNPVVAPPSTSKPSQPTSTGVSHGGG